MGMIKRLIAALVVAFATIAVAATPTQAAPDPYQSWLDETAVVVHHANGDGTWTTTPYTERQAGDPTFQAHKKAQFDAKKNGGSVSPNIVYWNCLSGIGCTWTDINGGGTKFQIPIGVYSTFCNALPNGTMAGLVSSASADYGSGYDLNLFEGNDCAVSYFDDYINLLSSHSVNFIGSLAYLNDEMGAFQICDYDSSGPGTDCSKVH